MRRVSLRWKIFGYSSGLLVMLVVATLFYVRARAGVHVNDRIQEGLEDAREHITRTELGRMVGLRETAALVASFPELKALLDTDHATVRDFLVTYLEQSRRAVVLVALDPAGRVIARIDLESGAPGAWTRWTGPVLEAGYAQGLLATDRHFYSVAVVAAEAGGRLFGFVLAGAPIDDDLARALRLGQNDIVLLGGDRVLGSTLSRASLPWHTIGEWRDGVGSASETNSVLIAGEQFVATETMLQGDAPGVLAVALASRDRAMQPYRNIEIGLLALGLLVIGIGVAGSAMLSKTIAAPVTTLVEETRAVAAGDLDYHLTVTSRDEIGLLADSFNTMVDERRRLEQQVQHSQKLEAVGQLAGGVAHDFNNLLTVITGRAEMLLETCGEPEVRRDVQLIYDASRRGAGLTRQLLAFSRRQVLRPRVIDLNEVVSGIQDMLRHLIGEDIDLRFSLPEQMPHVKADAGQLEQTLMNLVVNARDAMPDGGTLTVLTEHRVLTHAPSTSLMPIPPGSYVVLVVTDTGHGMDDSIRSRLFEPFFTTKDFAKGTGLGLSMVYGIVRQSGGYIDVVSAPQQGATFSIFLPETAAEREQVGDVLGQDAAGAGWETVLLVEDEHDVRDLIEEVLRSAGYQVLAAADGPEAMALSAAYTRPIHLMLTDVTMPHMQGPELARQLQASRPEMRVLFMSGYIAHIQDVTSRGVTILQKPFTNRELTSRVREVLSAPQQLAGPRP